MATELNNVNDQNMEQCYENLIVIDVGANLTNKKYSRDLESVIQRAKDAGKTPSSSDCNFYDLCYLRGTKDNGHWNFSENKQRSFTINSHLSRNTVFYSR